MPHDEKGREIPDPKPLEMPFGLNKPESIEDMIRRFVRQEASRAAQNSGMESFEEADDFEVDEEEIDEAPTRYMIPEVGPEGPESLDGVVQAIEKSAPDTEQEKKQDSDPEVKDDGSPSSV